MTCVEMTAPRRSDLYCVESWPGTQFPDDNCAALLRAKRVELPTVLPHLVSGQTWMLQKQAIHEPAYFVESGMLPLP
jgi:hypothetical protein